MTDTRGAAAAAGRGMSTAAAVSTAGRTTAAAGTAESPFGRVLCSDQHSTTLKELFSFLKHGSGNHTIS